MQQVTPSDRLFSFELIIDKSKDLSSQALQYGGGKFSDQPRPSHFQGYIPNRRLCLRSIQSGEITFPYALEASPTT